MKTETHIYTIGTQFAGYVANGDMDTLTDKEKSQFDDLEEAARKNAPEGYAFAHWSIQTDKHDEFTRCEATHLMGSCYQFDAVYFETNPPEPTREEKILALTQNEIDWFLGNGEELGLVQDVTAFFAKGGFTTYTDEQINDQYSRLTA
jgi:hypothetical protein